MQNASTEQPFSQFIFRLMVPVQRWPEIEQKCYARRSLYLSPCSQFSTLQSAKSDVTDSNFSASMNQLEVSAQGPREHRSTVPAAKSPTNMPLSASSLVTHPKGAKRRDSAELDHEDDEQCRQQHIHGHESGNHREVKDFSDDGCKVMVKNFDGFERVGKPFAMPRFHDGDEDIVNVRSSIMCKPSTINARSASLSPTCVSALARDEVVKSDADYDEPLWTIQEFKEYLGMLELLQDVSSDAEGGEMCLSADCLGQMERLLMSLLPQGV